MEFIASLVRLPPSVPHPSLDTQLIGPRVILRGGDSSDWRVWSKLRETSRDFLTPWEPMWPKDALSYGYYCSLLRRQWREWRNGHAYAFSIFHYDGTQPILVGGITLGDIIYAAAQKGTVGYWIGQPYARQGLMSEALDLVCNFAFTTLHLQRVEASCLPHNESSKALLRRMGFEQEGYAKAYLQINGKREDHLLWGRVCPGLAG